MCSLLLGALGSFAQSGGGFFDSEFGIFIEVFAQRVIFAWRVFDAVLAHRVITGHACDSKLLKALRSFAPSRGNFSTPRLAVLLKGISAADHFCLAGF